MRNRLTLRALRHVVMVSAVLGTAVAGSSTKIAGAPTTSRPAEVPTYSKDGGSTRRIVVLAEAGQTIHQPFADAALRWLQETAPKEGFTVDYIRTTDPIDEAYLAAHDLFVQVNYPPYRWTPVAEAAFKKAMEQGTIGWVGFHHASLLGKFDGFEMSPFFHQFMGNIVFKGYIPDFATGTVRVEDSAHPVVKGLPAAFTIENDEWYTYDRSPRPDVHVVANVDENSYEPARTAKMGDHPVIWTNPHYKGRNVYFQFGHKADLFQNSAFKTLFLNAIRWARSDSRVVGSYRGRSIAARTDASGLSPLAP